jgi:hypothetical protein
MKSCSDCSRRSGLVLALFSSLFLQAPTAAAESSLADLISQYEAAKKEWKASRARKPDPDRGGGWGRGGRRGRQAAPRLEPILESIARLGTDASLSYLVQEYRDP